MRAWIYILRFKDNDKFYVGSTINLERRLKQHQQGHTKSTKRLAGFNLVFSQEVDSVQIARRAESRIKSWKRRDYIEKIIKDGRISFLK